MLDLIEELAEGGRNLARLDELRAEHRNQAGMGFGQCYLPGTQGTADRMIKGRLAGDAWDELALLAGDLCATPAMPRLKVMR